MTTELDFADEAVSDITPKLGRRRYDEYKDIGVPWLGEIPSHWEDDRLKWSVEFCRNGTWGSEPDGEHDIICVRVADFDRTRLLVDVSEPTLRSVLPKDRRHRVLCRGDLLLEKSGGGELQPVGAVMFYQHDDEAVCSNFVARMPIVPEADSRYFAYLNAHLYASRVNVRSIKQTTGIQNLDAQSYLDETVPYPPLDEQRQIAAFLDRETTKIDELVAKKRRLIELLKEKRTALISHAVTKGLDPDAEMKDSGVEWLGEIPESWKSVSLRRLVQIIDCKHRTVVFTDDGYPVASIGEVQSLRIDLANAKKTTTEDYEEMIEGGRKPRVGDIIYSRNATVGAAAYVDVETEFCLGQDVCLLRTDRACGRYLVHLLRSVPIMEQLEAQMIGSTFKRINVAQINALRVCAPPLEEQQGIADYCDAIDAKYQEVTQIVARTDSYLREYRSALISASVTGKIDVRNC